ncbi:MAG TPA: acyl-CoA dehydrogenase family protein [Streptosporangiaceae bacterium]|jgi:alkylation response protein AidB-like acyl-CoA dehydrogenase
MTIRDRLALTDDERMLQATLREFLTARLPSAELRSALDSDAGYSMTLHARLISELGVGGLTIPEDFGGLGLSQAEACVVHAELGRALYPGPFLPGCLAAAALLAAGDLAACQEWLPRLADGSATGTVAPAGENGSWQAGRAPVQAEKAPGGWRLHGRSWFVLSGQAADIIIVPAAAASAPGMFLVESGAPGLAVTPMTGLDLTRRAAALAFDAVPARLLGRGGDAAGVLEQVERHFLLATAAEASGGISWCLDLGVGYARDREQFGRPIGSFQAVAHQCADMLADLQSAAAAARYAAVASAAGSEDAALAARVAALRGGESYRRVAEAAIHLLGGVGFTWEHDAHLYYRRAWSAQQLAGGPQAHRAAIADLAGL